MRTAKIGPDLRLEDEHPRPFQMGVLSLAYKPVEKKRFDTDYSNAEENTFCIH